MDLIQQRKPLPAIGELTRSRCGNLYSFASLKVSRSWNLVQQHDTDFVRQGGTLLRSPSTIASMHRQSEDHLLTVEQRNLSRPNEVCEFKLKRESNDFNTARISGSFLNSSWPSATFRPALVLFCLFILLASYTTWPFHAGYSVRTETASTPTLVKNALTAVTPLLEVFQVYPPVLTQSEGGSLELTDGSSNTTLDLVDGQGPLCQQVLAEHSFAYSYGSPFVGDYSPPGCQFNRITWNLTVTSAGRQFDRLGIVYLGDVEVFRTSTAEPTATGIEWVYLKVRATIS